MVFWEVNLVVGDGFDAVLEKKASWKFPVYYFSQTKDATHHDWTVHSKIGKLKSMHLDGKVKHVPPPKPLEQPDDEREAPPRLPNLFRPAPTCRAIFPLRPPATFKGV